MSPASYYDVCGFGGGPGDDCSSELPVPQLSRTALLLDFDGTLVDIAETPDGINVPDGLARLISKLREATDDAFALVTGRRESDIDGFLPTYDGTLISAHGARTRFAGKTDAHPLTDSDLVENIGRLVTRFAETIPGLLAERKPTGAVLHFRQNPEAEQEAQKFIRALEEVYGDFEMHVAKMAYELRPKGVSKDAAIARLLDRTPFSGRTPVFFGDDATDEPALSLVRERGGISVRVGEGTTAAEYRAESPAVVRKSLKRWCTR